MMSFDKLVVALLLSLAGTAVAAKTFTTAFTACPGVTNVLGIESILVNFFNNGAILGKHVISFNNFNSSSLSNIDVL